MWTSADTNREKYQETLVKLIKDNAERLASASDVQIEVSGDYVPEWYLIFDDLMEQAADEI